MTRGCRGQGVTRGCGGKYGVKEGVRVWWVGCIRRGGGVGIGCDEGL